MRTLDNINKFLVEKLGQKAQPTLLDAFNALSRAYGGEGKARSKEKALEELAIVFVGPAEGVQLKAGPITTSSPKLIGLISFADLRKLDTSAITNMSSMFSNCSALTNLNLSNFDTKQVTDMGSMFVNCSALTNLNLSNFDTSKVTNMSSMFSNCSALTSLDLSNFDTKQVTGMSFMFSNCSALTSLDLSNFDTSKVKGMGFMFSGCSALTSLDLSNFDTSKVTGMREMFSGCRALTSLDLSNFDTKAVTDMDYIFSNCSALTSVKFPGEGKWASNANIKTFSISASPLDVASIQGLAVALATKTSQCTLKLKSANWEAAKAADSTLETTLEAKNWVVTAV